jgi:hypothetical protein
MIASIYLDDLAQKTRRGQVGRVRAGRIPGGRSYGYDVVANGEDRGQRTINQAEADIVRRIFREYVEGSSALDIAGRLNQEGIAAPRGRQWNGSTINGSRKRLNGIINNRLYAGKIVYNRQRFICCGLAAERVASCLRGRLRDGDRASQTGNAPQPAGPVVTQKSAARITMSSFRALAPHCAHAFHD